MSERSGWYGLRRPGQQKAPWDTRRGGVRAREQRGYIPAGPYWCPDCHYHWADLDLTQSGNCPACGTPCEVQEGDE